VYGVLPSIFQPGLPRWTSRCFCQISIHRGVSLGGRPPTESCSTHCAERAYTGRKPGYTRDRFNEVRDMLRQEAVSIAQIARETGLTRQTSIGSRVTLRVLRGLWLLGSCEDAAMCSQRAKSNCNKPPLHRSPPTLLAATIFQKCL
jgi:hypothetical protein